jgi:hypothetical protein
MEDAMSRGVITFAIVCLCSVGLMAPAGEKAALPANPQAITFTPTKTDKQGWMIKVTAGDVTFLVPSLTFQHPDTSNVGEMKAINGHLTSCTATDSEGNQTVAKCSGLSLFLRQTK